MTAYYNEFDPGAAAWLRELIAGGHVAPGVVDTRSIADVQPADLEGFTQVHLFAGIGGWSRALRLARVRDDVPIWTGSCPCQPFSTSGKQKGLEDDRHLWPHMRRLIAALRPARVVGEQVASPAALGWWDAVHADLEDEGYAGWAADLCSAGIGAPHRRQRLYWVADRGSPGLEGFGRGPEAAGGHGRTASGPNAAGGGAGGLAIEHARGGAGPFDRRWEPVDWLYCRDAQWRPVEPGTFPLVDGIPAGVGSSSGAVRALKLRGYGNAIDPNLAATFLTAISL
jgi:DNA (cytosine-5)-methyltransferase 1